MNPNTIRNPEMFMKAIDTLLTSWGGDTPPEAIWALNELVNWLNESYDYDLDCPTEADYYYPSNGEDFHEKLEDIRIALSIFREPNPDEF